MSTYQKYIDDCRQKADLCERSAAEASARGDHAMAAHWLKMATLHRVQADEMADLTRLHA